MDLNQIAIKPRIRNPYEAIDLGLLMARRWWKPLFLSWFIPALICFSVLSVIFHDSTWVAIMLTWWLKPLWDRAPLYIASRKLFGDKTSAAELIRALPKLYWNDAFAWLLWRRFSFTRSFDMPVTVLEGQKHSARRKRLDVLHQVSTSAASWLTFVCIHLEMILTIGIFSFVILLIPDQVDVDMMGMMQSEDYTVSLVTNFLSFISMSLIAPFYTMAGFALYINRRIKLEAWDIEIRFRHMANVNKKKSALAPALLICMALFVSFSFTGETYASETETVSMQQESKKTINEILAGEDFHKKKKVSGWRLKNVKESKENEEIPGWVITFIEILEYLFSDDEKDKSGSSFGFANALEALLWVLVILLIAYGIYRISLHIGLMKPSRSIPEPEKMEVPDILFGLDVRKDSIPKDVNKQTLELWRSGKHREAVGLLYRSTLSLLIHRFLFEIYHGYTEQECSDLVQQSDNKLLRDFVAQLTSTWQQVAYAHKIPVENRIVLLCEQWTEVSKIEK